MCSPSPTLHTSEPPGTMVGWKVSWGKAIETQTAGFYSQTFWFSRSEGGPESLHCHHAHRCCWGYQPRGQCMRTTALSHFVSDTNLQMTHLELLWKCRLMQWVFWGMGEPAFLIRSQVIPTLVVCNHTLSGITSCAMMLGKEKSTGTVPQCIISSEIQSRGNKS